MQLAESAKYAALLAEENNKLKSLKDGRHSLKKKNTGASDRVRLPDTDEEIEGSDGVAQCVRGMEESYSTQIMSGGKGQVRRQLYTAKYNSFH